MRQNWKNAVGLTSKRAMTPGAWMRTSIKIKKVWMYLYRAVDSDGNTLEFLLSSTRDAEAASRFFLKALSSPAGSTSQASVIDKQVAGPFEAHTYQAIKAVPRVINVDKNAAYPKAIA